MDMTLDEAIEHAEEQAEKHRGTVCGVQHQQLANWLKELREVRQQVKELSEEMADVVANQNIGDDA